MNDSPGLCARVAATMRSTDGRALFKLLALFAVIGVAILVAGRLDFFQLREIPTLAATVREVRDLPGIIWIFLFTFIVATTVGLPATVFFLAGGAIFGLGLGLALNVTSAMLGAAGAYTLARTLGRPAVRSVLPRRAAATLDRLTARHGFTTLLRLRLLPIIPFNGLNFGSGLAGVRVRDFLAATTIGAFPAIFVWTYFADALLSGVEDAQQRALVHLALAGVLLVLLSFSPSIHRWLTGGKPKETLAGQPPSETPAPESAAGAHDVGTRDRVSATDGAAAGSGGPDGSRGNGQRTARVRFAAENAAGTGPEPSAEPAGPSAERGVSSP